LKSFTAPPEVVKTVFQMLCMCFGIKPIIKKVDGKKVEDWWKPSKTMMTDLNFLMKLKDYDKDNIQAALIKKLTPILS